MKNLIQKLSALTVAIVLSVTSLSVLVVPRAFAATKTWTGGGSDNNMNTGANWGGVAPTAGDDLIFPANSPRLTITNNYTAGTSFNSITFSGAITDDSNYTINGNALTIVAGITDSTTGASGYSGNTINTNLTFDASQAIVIGSDRFLELGGVVSGTGSITKSGTGQLVLDEENTYSGHTFISAGSVFVLGTLGNTTGYTHVNGGSSLIFQSADNKTVSEDITLDGTGTDDAAALTQQLGFGPLEAAPDKTITYNGTVTLESAADFLTSGLNATFSDFVYDDFTLSQRAGTFGTVTINGTVLAKANYLSSTITDSSAGTDVTVGNREEIAINGVRGDVTVSYDGVLKGTGTVGGLTVESGGMLAEGLSPGCMAAGDTQISGTLSQEIGGSTACTGYDQLQVTGTVNLTGSTLETSAYNNYVPKVGESYTIITNDGTDAVTGTFTGLAEGATLSLNGKVLKISYVGGTGNDVVLSVQSDLGVPNTGIAPQDSSPAGIILAILATTALAAGLTRRLATVRVRQSNR